MCVSSNFCLACDRKLHAFPKHRASPLVFLCIRMIHAAMLGDPVTIPSRPDYEERRVPAEPEHTRLPMPIATSQPSSLEDHKGLTCEDAVDSELGSSSAGMCRSLCSAVRTYPPSRCDGLRTSEALQAAQCVALIRPECVFRYPAVAVDNITSTSSAVLDVSASPHDGNHRLIKHLSISASFLVIVAVGTAVSFLLLREPNDSR